MVEGLITPTGRRRRRAAQRALRFPLRRPKARPVLPSAEGHRAGAGQRSAEISSISYVALFDHEQRLLVASGLSMAIRERPARAGRFPLSVTTGLGSHLFPSRTQQLSPSRR